MLLAHLVMVSPWVCQVTTRSPVIPYSVNWALQLVSSITLLTNDVGLPIPLQLLKCNALLLPCAFLVQMQTSMSTAFPNSNKLPSQQI